MMIAAWK